MELIPTSVYALRINICSSNAIVNQLVHINEGVPEGLVAASSFVISDSVKFQFKTPRSSARCAALEDLVVTAGMCCKIHRSATSGELLLCALPMAVVRCPSISSVVLVPRGEYASTTIPCCAL